MARDHRRLAAIVSADVVGYSLLMGRDDSSTLAGLKAHRRELIDPKISEHDGRIVKTTGDGLLLEFPSVVDAVRCAVDVQGGMAERNAGVPPEQRIEFRIGINVGDIIIDGEDIYGDGVNVAARLQTLAEPGGVCVSRVVRDQVLDKLTFAFEDLGPQEVKNIARPVEVYRVDWASGTAQTTTRGRRHWQLRSLMGRRLARAIIVVPVLAVGYFVADKFWLTRREAVPGNVTATLTPVPSASSAISAPEKSSAALGDRPIAVLPFVALPTGDGSTAQGVSFARDVSVALGRTLAHFAWRTVAVPDVEKQTGRAEMQRLGSKLNADYLVSGNFRHADGQIRVDVQIMDGDTGTQIWADRVETPEAKAARFPDLVLLRTTAVLRRGIYRVAAGRIAGTPPERLNPSEMVILAGETEDQAAKVRLYVEAMHRDPNLVPALVGWADRLRSLEAPAAENERNLQQADDLSKRAIRLAPDDADAWYVRGWVLWHQDRYDAALTANARAIELDPSYAKSYVARGLYTISIGQPEAALPVLERARDIDSTVDGVASRTACRAFLSLGRYDEAVQNCERAMATDESLFAHVYLTAAYAQKGDMARAAESKARLLRLRPDLTLETLRRRSNKPDVQRFREQWDKHVIAGLRRAGIPER